MSNTFLQFRNVLKLIIKNDLLLPLALLLTYIFFMIIARRVVPTSEELIVVFENLYKSYGYEIIFVSALLESLILINLFVPGMVALALGAIFARTGQTDLTWVILTASSGIVLGYILDFSLGFFGFGDFINKLGYKDFLKSSKEKLEKFGNRGLIIGFFHTNIGSFLALTAGIIRYSFINFLIVAIAATLVWTTIWGVAAFFLGDIFLYIVKRYSFLLILLMIGFFILSGLWNQSKVKKLKK